ncbi:MAG: GHKL domain-containing protein [Clostridia bacterium]|nr:GHKL domain-containing protein [Clostridia bacterium]
MVQTIITTTVNTLATVIEILLSVVLMNSFFAQRFQKRYVSTLVIVASAAALFWLNFISVDYAIKTAVEVLLIIAMLLLLYKGNLRDILIYFILWGIGLSFSNFLADIIISLLPEDLHLGTGEPLFLSAVRIILPKLLLMILVVLLSAFIRRETLNMNLKYWVILLAVPLITIAILTVFQYYIDSMPSESRVINNVTTITINGESFTMPGLTIYGYMIAAVIGLVFINIIIFLLFAQFQRSTEIISRYEIALTQKEMQSRSIEQLEDSYTRMRELRHDMQNQLVILNSLMENGKYDELQSYIKTMTNKVDEAAFMTISGQSAVDAILNDKLAAAHKNKIATHFDIAKLDDCFAEPMDICIILANALDNAIEACAKLDEDKERYIKLKIAKNESYIVVSCANPVAAPPKTKNGKYISDKSDSKNHGFGLKSITDTADKYNGEYMMRCVDDQFTIIVKLNNTKDTH